jgi:RimJ/RimL family protein N-acetyltransferase
MITEPIPFRLETDRLIIRRFTNDDLEAFLAYRNDPEVAKWQGWSVPYPREKAVEFIEEMKNRDPNEPGEWLQIAIVTKAENEFIGDGAFFIKKDDNRQAYVGCTIAQKHWRKGYGVEATRRLLEYLFETRGIHRVIAETDVENAASYSTLERLGFRREAHLVENIWFKGNWASEYHYAMLEREWKLLSGA